MYFPLSQAFRNPVAYLVRTTGDPGALAAAVREVVRSVEPTLPIYEMLPLSAYLERARAVQRFTMVLVGAFAAARPRPGRHRCLRRHCVLRSSAPARVRRPDGSGRHPGQIGALVLREGARLTGIGAALGLAGAAALGALIRGQLFGVSSG